MPPTQSDYLTRRLAQTIEAGYLVDNRYASDYTQRYVTEAGCNHLPAVVAFPWRRNWYGLQLRMPYTYKLSDRAVTQLASQIEQAQAEGFRHIVHFLPGGFQVWGILPERVKDLAKLIGKLANDPAQTVPVSGAIETPEPIAVG